MPHLHIGGAEKLYVNLAIEWSKYGHSVTFLLLQKKGELLSLLPTEIKVRDLRVNKIRQSVLPIVKYLRDSQPDIVLSAMWPLTSMVFLAWMFSFKKGKLFLSEHVILSESIKRELKVSLYLAQALLRLTHSFSSGVIVVSKAVKKDLCLIGSLSPNRVKIIYNPAAIGIDPTRESQDVQKKIWGKCDYHIISVGRLKFEKDYETLIRAFYIVSKEIDAKLIILGDGSMRGNLERLISKLDLKNKVILPGFVMDPYTWYRSADIFVLSSLWEGFGNVIVEALECGIPVVSTNCPGGPAEILDNGRYGSLVPVGDYQTLANTIVKDLRKDHNSNALKERAKSFSLPIIANQYLDYFIESSN